MIEFLLETPATTPFVSLELELDNTFCSQRIYWKPKSSGSAIVILSLSKPAEGLDGYTERVSFPDMEVRAGEVQLGSHWHRDIPLTVVVVGILLHPEPWSLYGYKLPVAEALSGPALQRLHLGLHPRHILPKGRNIDYIGLETGQQEHHSRAG